MDLLRRVRRFIRQHDLTRPETRVVAAVSAGSDSMTLLHVLRELHEAGELNLAGVAHFNHRLRPSADEHERFVREAASACHLAFVSDREDVATAAARDRTSIEHAGRRARYAFFERARVSLAADVVALGHTRDDQAETFLLRLTRGAGPRGLAGMHPRAGAVVRPLLDCHRGELRAWLAGRAAIGASACQYLEDESNRDLSIPRNRVRHELLPLLVGRFNPSIVDVLARESALQQDIWAWMEQASGPFLETPGVLSIPQLRDMPAALRRLVVWRALTGAAGPREISSDHVASVIRLIEEDARNEEKGLDLPGQHVQRIADRIVLTSRTGSRGSQGSTTLANGANQFRYSLSIPGKVFIPEADSVISAEPAPTRPEDSDSRAGAGNGVEAWVRRDLIWGSLAVRNRRPGDRYRPVGLRGSKKLQDLFVDRKLARADRDAVPLVVDESDRIVWVAGYGIDDAFRVTDASQAVLVLRLTRASHGGAPEWLGGSA